jgi:hypothetical protein
VSALSTKLAEAQLTANRDAAKQAAKAKTLSPSDLLGLTQAALLARASSDGDAAAAAAAHAEAQAAPGTHPHRALFACKRGARPFLYAPGDGESAPMRALAESSGGLGGDDEYWVPGMAGLGVEECVARCAKATKLGGCEVAACSFYDKARGPLKLVIDFICTRGRRGTTKNCTAAHTRSNNGCACPRHAKTLFLGLFLAEPF